MGNPSIAMSRFLPALVLALAVGITGCPDPESPPDTSITDADAANLFAAILTARSGGYLAYVADAASIAHGGDLPERASKGAGRAVARNVILDRNRSVTIGGTTYAYRYTVWYDILYTDGIRAAKENYTPGNKEVRLQDTLYPGTLNIPTLQAADGGWSLVHLYDTDQDRYHLQGRFFRFGNYTFPGTGRTFRGRIETTTLIPGVGVDPVAKTIVDGNVDVVLKGTDAAGNLFEAGGTYMFRVGQPVRLSTNAGHTYVLDMDKGSATLER
jgi:hypothetical protein